MIRINLLGAQKGKNKRSAASAAAVMEVGDVGSPKMKVLVVLVLAAPGQRGLLVPAGQTAQGHRCQDGSGAAEER